MLDMDKSMKKELLYLALGEGACAALTVVGFLVFQLISKEKAIFDYTVITGALLGAFVVVINFLILAVSANRAINTFLEERGSKELTEEEAEAFAKEHQARVKLAVTRSYIIRSVLTAGTLVIAFVLAWFNPIATAIPLFSYKPVLYLIEFLKRKVGNG